MTHNRANAGSFAAAVEAYLEADTFDLSADPTDPGPDDPLAGLRSSLSDPDAAAAAAAAVNEWKKSKR